ncbi:transketolase family protein [Anaerorhabdus furcosa]|uniref:Transketolase n=1 Tax=Anaerorhabdus furcosa TaxID=118967 RepID=A0A1T4MN34_9FIRM|nr:transketolase family protein [Anaerorhabdus furcosa]SJZ68128.1 transketolase [Anaerorhabdus furcosa]
MAKATREAYGIALAKLIEENDKIIVLDADLTKSTKTADAKKACPERHFNMGIAEGNMMSTAAGIAASGYTVFASSFSIFSTGRAWEQVRNSIGYPHLNVKVCGTHAGISVGEDGASHQALEDIALMRVIPGMKVYQPCDEQETYAIINHVAKEVGPCYVRLGRGKVGDVYPEGTDFKIGKISTLNQGSKVAILATGLMVQEALKAKDELVKEGINPTVINVSCIKPLDEEGILEVLKNHDVILTAEEHSIVGGLGGAISELASEKCPKKVVRIGTKDTFGESGTSDALLEKYGLTSTEVIKKVKENI